MDVDGWMWMDDGWMDGWMDGWPKGGSERARNTENKERANDDERQTADGGRRTTNDEDGKAFEDSESVSG